MEYNQESRTKPIYVYDQFISTKVSRSLDKEKIQSFQQVVLGKLDIYIQKNESGTPTLYHIQKVTQKDQRPKM